MATRSDNLQIHIAVDGDGQVKASLAGVEQSLGKVGGNAAPAAAGIGLIESSVRSLVGAFTLVEGAKWLVDEIVNTQKLQVQLKAVTGSQGEFNDALAISKKMAGETANTADQVTAAYIALRQRGLAPSLDSMRAFANIAAATGKSIDEVAGAVGGSLTGQIRGLQELGVRVQEQNGQLVGTFRGTKEVIGTTADDIVAYLLKIGNTQYAGAAAAQADTLVGSWAHLKQAAIDLAEKADSGLGITQDLDDLITAATHALGLLDQLGTWAKDHSAPLLDKIKLQAGLIVGPAIANHFGFGEFSNVQGGSATAAETSDLGANTEAETRNKLATEGLTTAKQQQADATAAVIAQLRTQLISLTAGEAATVRYATAQQAAKAGTPEQAAAILQLGEAIASLIEKRKADADATKLETDLEAAHAEGLKQFHDVLDAVVKKENDLHDAMKSVLDVIDPTGAKVRTLQDDYDKLAKALDAMKASGEASTAELDKAGAALDALAAKIKEASAQAAAAKWFGGITGDMEGAAGQLDSMLTEAAATFTKSLKAGFHDAGSDFSALLGNIADQIINTIIKNKILKNIETAMNGGTLNTGQLMQGGAAALGVYGGSTLGGGTDTAQMGASIGTAAGAVLGNTVFAAFGGTYWGPIIGGIIGGVLGGLFGGSGVAKVYSGPNSGSSTSGIDAFGRVQSYTNGLGDNAEAQLLQALMTLDNTIAKMLTPAEIAAVKLALVGHVSEASTPDAALADRLNVIIAAVAPQWAAFLNKFESVDTKGAAFASLRHIDDELKNFDTILVAISGTPLEQLTSQLTVLDKAVTDTAAALAAAITDQDPVAIEAAGAAAVQAVVNRYNTEIALAHTLEDALNAAKQAAYQLNLTIAQRIAGITGDNSAVRAINWDQIHALQGSIPGATPAQGLGDLNTYLGAVDNWLQTGQTDINNWLNTSLAGIQAQEQALTQWAQDQQQAQQAAAQAANAAAQAARQRELNALAQQLALANAWVAVLDHAKQLQDSMQFGSANPLGGYGQLDALNQAIGGMLGTAGGGVANVSDLTATAANHLLDLLNERLQLIQSSGLYQRASGGYLDQYNATLALIEQVQARAQPGVDEATRLQQQMTDLQAQTIVAVSAGSVDITAQMKVLTDQEAAIRLEAQKQLDDLNKQALDYYTWAQTEAVHLEDARAQELLDQLNELTGGLPVQDFIALKQAEATDLLTDIRDNLRAFLDAISGGGVGATGSTGTGSGGGGGGGGGGARMAQPAGLQGDVNVVVNVQALGLSPDEAVNLFHREIRGAATDLKRLLKTA
jgi:hypothetical protein